MPTQSYRFYPFFDPEYQGKTLGWRQKILISFGLGLLYAMIQYLNLEDKSVYFEQFSWVLSLVITTAMLAVYIATAILRENIAWMNENSVNPEKDEASLRLLMSDRNFLIAGLVFATATTLVSNSFGIPADFSSATIPFLANNLGAMLSGFTCGLSLWGIFSVIVVLLRFAPNLQFSLNPDNPDGAGGIKKLGDSLWFFGTLIAAVGLLVSAYMFSVDWTNLDNSLVQFLFVLWLAMPYVMAISIVLVPGLAVRRQVNEFKSRRQGQLKKERAEAYSSYKDFDHGEDDDIIANKKELQERLSDIQEQMERLQSMRASPIDSSNKK